MPGDRAQHAVEKSLPPQAGRSAHAAQTALPLE